MPRGNLDRNLGSRIDGFKGPGLLEVLAQVPKEPHHIAIGARISHRLYFTIDLLSISTSLVPSAHEVGFVWL